MAISEDVRDVATKLTATLNPTVLAVIILFILNDGIVYLGFWSLQEKRIDAILEMFRICATATLAK